MLCILLICILRLKETEQDKTFIRETRTENEDDKDAEMKKVENHDKERIGLILSYFSDYLFPEVYEGIQTVLEKQGYATEVFVGKNRLNEEAIFLEGLLLIYRDFL